MSRSGSRLTTSSSSSSSTSPAAARRRSSSGSGKTRSTSHATRRRSSSGSNSPATRKTSSSGIGRTRSTSPAVRRSSGSRSHSPSSGPPPQQVEAGDGLNYLVIRCASLTAVNRHHLFALIGAFGDYLGLEGTDEDGRWYQLTLQTGI